MEQQNKIYKVREAFDLFYKELNDYYSEEEINSQLYILFEEYLKKKKTDILLYPDALLPSSQMNYLSLAIEELKNYKPLQYIIGKANFNGIDFIVTPDVLIPRPETEELVLWVIKDFTDDINKEADIEILDIGSSSGCIAISLARTFKLSKITGIDNNKDALNIARRNNELHNTHVGFLMMDILDEDEWYQADQFDVIVSNPPYIRESEKSQMSRNVLNYEPHEALFVSDEDPLIFYRTILRFSQFHLKHGGKIYFEINEAFGKEVTAMLEEYCFKDVLLRKDINGRDRFVRGSYYQ